MLHEINRRDVITNLLVWISGVLDAAHSPVDPRLDLAAGGDGRRNARAAPTE